MNNRNKSVKKIFRLALGAVLILAFVVLTILKMCGKMTEDTYKLASSIAVAGVVVCFFPYKRFEKTERHKQKISKRTLLALLFAVVAIPVTMYIGIHYLEDRKYYFISILMIIEILIPFLVTFENRKPKARELVIISVLCAIAVSGRLVFYMLPQFKPTMAVVIVAGAVFGGEAGFLVGAISAFVSNFFFGQGPWTPWQMVSFGAVGFIAGLLFETGFVRKNRITLCVFGLLATVVIYGFIANTGSVIMMQQTLTPEAIWASELMGIPFDLIHGISVAFFLWFIAEPMTDKLERIRTKYGLLD